MISVGQVEKDKNALILRQFANAEQVIDSAIINQTNDGRLTVKVRFLFNPVFSQIVVPMVIDHYSKNGWKIWTAWCYVDGDGPGIEFYLNPKPPAKQSWWSKIFASKTPDKIQEFEEV
jgi:hypothetical protein